MLAGVLFLIASAAYWWWRRQHAKTTEPPYLPGAWPIVGHIPMLFGNTCTLWDRCDNFAKYCNDMGAVISMSFGSRIVYLVTDPDDCQTVASMCLEKDPIYGLFKSWLGHGLFTARYSIWKNDRKLLNPAFNQTLLDTFIGVFNRQSRKLVSDLEKEVENGKFDHSIYTRHNALETICMTALGVDFTDLNSTYVKTIELVLETYMERLIKVWWHTSYTFAWSKLKKKQDACVKILHNMSNTVLKKRKTELSKNKCDEKGIITGTKFKPFIDLILELSAEKGVFTDKQIREHVDTILVTGHDTTANVLMFTMILLGSHPEAQDKVFAEILEVLGRDRDVEKTDLSKMVYLEAVLKESMRLFTISPVIARRLDRDVKLKNYTLTAGRTCALLLCGLHQHPIWGPDAHEFKPERWLEPSKLPGNTNAYAAFSLGKRQCIGRTYAMMSMKTTLAHVVRRYRIEADHTRVRLKIDIMLKPFEGHFISIEKRT